GRVGVAAVRPAAAVVDARAVVSCGRCGAGEDRRRRAPSGWYEGAARATAAADHGVAAACRRPDTHAVRDRGPPAGARVHADAPARPGADRDPPPGRHRPGNRGVVRRWYRRRTRPDAAARPFRDQPVLPGPVLA